MSTVEVEFAGGAGGRLQAGAIAGSALIDVADRAGRLLGAVASVGGTVDVSDRATRIVGRVRTGIGDTLNAGGRVVAPGAGAAIATSGAGGNNNVYEIYVTVTVGPGGLVADAGNMELREGATVLAILAAGAPGSASFGPFRRTNAASAAYSVNATGAATAGVPYAATLAAVRVE